PPAHHQGQEGQHSSRDRRGLAGQVRWRVECQAGEHQRGGRGQGRDPRDAQERQALQGDGRQPLHRHPAQPAPQGPVPGPGRERRGGLLMTAINATVVAGNGATYSPLHKMFGVLIRDVPGADFRSVSAKLDLSSPEAYEVSYRELLDKLEIPEEWKVVPMEVHYNPSDDEADIDQALVARG